jgi:signal transduction histidine kinase
MPASPEKRASRRTQAVFEGLFAALARVVSVAPGNDIAAFLTAAAREAATLAGADVIVLHLPGGGGSPLDVRIPEGISWPTRRLVGQWHVHVNQHRRAVALTGRDLPKRQGVHAGRVLPVFTPGGAIGALAVLTTSRTAPTAAQYAQALLLIETAVARAEAIQVKHDAQSMTATEVRDRIAREIHDGPLQGLSGIMLHLRLARTSAEGRLANALGDLEAEMERSIRQLRILIRHLRVAHPGASLHDRIRAALARLAQTSGVSSSLKWHGAPDALQNQVADEVFQVVNEALANVYRHAAAKRVEVSARVRGDEFEITVRDDGIGFHVARALRMDLQKQSFGLISMRERVAALGGTLSLRSQPGRGTRVIVTVPLKREPGQSAAGLAVPRDNQPAGV